MFECVLQARCDVMSCDHCCNTMDAAKAFLLTDRCLLWKNAAAVLGLACVAVFAFKQLRLLYGALRAYVMTPLTHKDLKKYGSWAVVTGASDGIGKAYCHELAKQGLNVVLMSRTKAKLDAVAEELKSKFNIETKVIVVDFSGGKEIYAEIRPQLAGMDIGVLVNNVGMMSGFLEYFINLADDDIWKIMVCNTAAVTMMTHMLLPEMVKKKKGVIVNVSSGGSQFPTSLLAVYGATKVYTDFFSRALAREYASKGIIVQSLLTGVVTTNMSKEKDQSLFTPSPATYVKSAVGTIGILSRTSGYWPHSFQMWVAELLPSWLLGPAVDWQLATMRTRTVKEKQKVALH